MKVTTVAQITRAITFFATHPVTKIVGQGKTLEAGTRVYVERETRYGYVVRVCGTLLTTTIPASAFVVVDVREW